MNKKHFLQIFSSVCVLGSLILTGCNNPKIKNNIESAKPQNDVIENTTGETNMYELASFLMDKKEHYPFSDEFIEKYQQNSGGYIEYAESLGMEVNKQKHLPNQKWHFFDSWYIRSIEDGSLSYTDSAKKRVYTNLKCPELLLWIYEACDVSPTKVREAMKIAEHGKVTHENLAKTTSLMREKVLWEDLHITADKRMANSVTFEQDTYTIHLGDKLDINSIVSPSNSTDTPNYEITSGNEFIELNQSASKCTVTAKELGTAEISVKYNKYATATATINVVEAEKPMINNVPSIVDLGLNNEYKLNPTLNIGSGTFTYSVADQNIATVTTEGLIQAKNYGETTITISCNENNSLTKIINVDVKNHGSNEAPLSVLEAKNLVSNYIANNGDDTKSEVYVKGQIKDYNAENNTFKLVDINDKNTVFSIKNPANLNSFGKISNNDVLTLKGFVSNENANFVINNSTLLTSEKGESKITILTDNYASILYNEAEITTPLSFKNGETFTFKVVPASGRTIKEIQVNGNVITLTSDNVYSIIIDGDTRIEVVTLDPNAPTSVQYGITYDLGTRKTAKKIDSPDEIYSTFVTANSSNIITSVSDNAYIYGGGNGGRGATNWYTGNMLKFGTTSVEGALTLNLSQKVDKIIITGYSTSESAKIRVGDAASTDWTGTLDNKTVEHVCNDLTLSVKENVEANLASSITLNFTATKTLKIATIKAAPIYITAIELFIAK